MVDKVLDHLIEITGCVVATLLALGLLVIAIGVTW
jgi:hypothetical protein